VGTRAGLESGKSCPHRDSIPDRPARSSAAIPSELPDPLTEMSTRSISWGLLKAAGS